MLGPLQMLAFAQAHPNAVRRIHALSRDRVQNFPMMAASLGLTLNCIRVRQPAVPSLWCSLLPPSRRF
jgi:hypothetical protein